MTSIETYLRYQDVFGAASTVEQFEMRLRALDLGLVLRLFGPINTVCSRRGLPNYQAAQIGLIRELFDKPTIRQIDQYLRTQQGFVTVFHRKQCLFIMREAMRLSPDIAGMQPTPEVREQLGALIEETIGLPGERWKVLASIRSFDLQHGDKFLALFAGSPPCVEFATKEFKKVRHIHVTAWSDEELDDLLARTPRLASALAACSKSLRGLALVPFNTQLLAELITDGIEPEALNTLSTQVDLLDLYWKKRVYNHGQAVFGCLRRILKEMVEKRSLQVSSASVDPCEPVAFERLLKNGVLVQPGGVRYLSFRHNILFDYGASQLYLDTAQGDELKRLFERGQGLGLLLAPALGYALQELWSSDAGRSAFWTTALQLVGDKSVDPIARSVAARSCCELPHTEEDITGLIEAVLATPGAAIALHHIVGSLAIHFEDHPRLVAPAPWVRLAAETSTRDDLAAVLSFLLNILIPRGANDVAS